MKLLTALVTAVMLFPAAGALASEDIKEIPACQYCGMDRDQFGQTRMLIEYEGGSQIGVCSIHDAAVDLAQSISKTISRILTADYNSRKLVDAEKATWVLGGDIPGVMAKKSRVAFGDKNDALAFQKEHGGDIAGFDQAIDDTYDEMWNDIKMIREKRAKMKKMKGMKGTH